MASHKFSRSERANGAQSSDQQAQNSDCQKTYFRRSNAARQVFLGQRRRIHPRGQRPSALSKLDFGISRWALAHGSSGKKPGASALRLICSTPIFSFDKALVDLRGQKTA